jgi:hypothetical protein
MSRSRRPLVAAAVLALSSAFASPVVTSIVGATGMFGGLAGVAHADAKSDAKKDIQAKVKEAMENFDLLEYEEAKKLLAQALATAKKAKLDRDPIVAQIHVRLGIVFFAGLQDPDAAKVAFAAAVELDPKVQIEAAYKTPDMQKLLEEARSGGGAAPSGGSALPGGPGGGDDGSCKGLTGIEHTIIDEAPAGAPVAIEARIGADVAATKVAVLFRAPGATDFTEVKLGKAGGCGYTGSIPTSALAGGIVHYYVAAYNKAGKVVASKGSSGAPNIIEVSGGSAATDDSDNENPLDKGGRGGGGAASGDGGTVEGGVTVGGKKPTVFVAIVAGTGGGYVTGKTEQAASEVKCCFAPGLLHLLPEIGVYLSPQMTVSLAGRIGFPIGANITGHSTVAPAALLRLRYGFGENGEGAQVSGALGGGIIRNTIGLTEADPEMDTDIAAIGPLLAGVGAGYIAGLGGPLKLTAEVQAIAAIPVVDEIDAARMNFGLQIDVNVGLLFGF